MQAISVKELRTKFPFVRSELKKGTSFLIIHKSKAIAQLQPIGGEKGADGEFYMSEDEKEMLEDLQRAAAEDINKFLPPITKEEHDYYMSLPPYKE